MNHFMTKPKAFIGTLIACALPLLVGSCAANVGAPGQDIGEVQSDLNKCQGAVNGSQSYCQNNTCGMSCISGEGNCNYTTDCAAGMGLTCVSNVGTKFGFAAKDGVCLVAHCHNNVKDADETGVDCGATTSYACGQCQANCSDHIQNNGELGLDCGGPCPTVCPGTFQGSFAQKSGGATSGAATSHGIARDASNNVYVIGTFTGTISFGGSTLTSNGGTDTFLAKFSSAGALTWIKQFGDPTNLGIHGGSQFGLGVASYGNGDTIIVGYYDKTIKFSGAVSLTSGSSGASEDIFVARINSAGNAVWANSYGDSSGSQQAYAVAIDASNATNFGNGTSNFAVVGDYRGDVSFGGTANPNAGVAADWNAFIAVLTSNGAHVWSKKAGASVGKQRARGVVFDKSGNVSLVGQFEGTIAWSGATLTSAGGDDIYVGRFTSAGGLQFQTRAGDAMNQRARGVIVNGSSEVITVGYMQGSMTVGACGTVTSAGGYDTFLLHQSTGASCIHLLHFGDGANQYGDAISVDSASEVAIGGQFCGTESFGAGTYYNPVSIAGTCNEATMGGNIGGGPRDAFIAKFSSSLVPKSAKAFSGTAGATSDEFVTGVTQLLTSRNVIAYGYFQSPVNPGGGSIALQGTATEDVFLAAFSP